MNIIDFKPIEKSDKKIFDEFFHKNYFESSKHNFTNFFMWRKLYNIHWTVENDILFIASITDKKFKSWQPICSAEKNFESIEKILHYKNNFAASKKFMFFALEKFFVEELKKYSAVKFEFESSKDTSDYVYLAENLINLSGRKYHSKKNHLNRFYELYPTAKYFSLTSKIISSCRDSINHWYEIASSESEYKKILSLENFAINEIFDDFDYFKIKGGAIEVDGKIIAVTFGEQLNSDTAVIHVEKANPEIRGAYPAINRNFVANEWSQMKFINREEDMGVEGLRKAKESYKPIKMIERFNAVLK